MTTQPLKPCPFCGEKEHLKIIKEEDINDVFGPYKKVLCCLCEAEGPYDFCPENNNPAIEKWNQRAYEKK